MAERVEAERRRGTPALFAGTTAVILGMIVGLLVVVRQNAVLLGIDEKWAGDMFALRGAVGETVAVVFDTLGGHLIGVLVIPALITIALLLARRPWAAGYYLAATVGSALIVQLLKSLFGRARPEDMLVTSDYGSFPSGHVANAATMAVALGVIFPQVWVWIAGAVWTVAMAISRTYLGVHWLTDTLGGMLLGAGVALLLWAAFATRLDRERAARREFRRRRTDVGHSLAHRHIV